MAHHLIFISSTTLTTLTGMQAVGQHVLRKSFLLELSKTQGDKFFRLS